ncbi:hypothetical protein HDV05_007319, partial [Chytridiales sp. JEL 0842]
MIKTITTAASDDHGVTPTHPINANINTDLIIYLSAKFMRPRELLNLASTCKRASQWLTYDVVLESVLHFGSISGRKSVEMVLELCKNGSIWTPSPLRLLRLSLAKRCESASAKNLKPGQ